MTLPRMVQLGVVLAALLAGARAAAPQDGFAAGLAAFPQPPHFHIERNRDGILLTGLVSSDAHEAILRDVAASHAPATTAAFDLRPAEPLPPGWALVTELTLRAMLWTQFSEAEITAESVWIRGVTAHADAWNESRSRLAASLLTGMQLETQVIEVPPLTDYAAVCLRQFEAVMKTRKLEFAVAGSNLESGARALLDGLIEVAADCPDARLSIRASGDGPASVTGNRRLAEARLQAIVDYLAAHGLPGTRIRSLSVADAAAPHGRAVTFAVSFAEAGSDAVAADAVP